MKLLLKIDQWVKKISLTAAVIIFCMIGIAIFAQIVCRKCFDIALMWVDEFSRYGLVWFIFLGGAAAIDGVEETCVTFVRQRIPQNMLRWINLLFHLSIIVFLIVLTKTGYSFAQAGKLSKTVALNGISQFIPFMAIPVGSFLITFSFVVRTITDFFGIPDSTYDIDDKKQGGLCL